MIFMETAVKLHQIQRHAVIECFPVDKVSELKLNSSVREFRTKRGKNTCEMPAEN